MNNNGYASGRSDLRKGKEKETNKQKHHKTAMTERREEKNCNIPADTRANPISAKLRIKQSTTAYEKTKTRTWLIMKLHISNSVINEATVSLLPE